jgi:IS30 family transposase
MSYFHLTTFERAKIEILHQNGHSLRAIERELKRSSSTISRELKRNEYQAGEYRAEKAQECYHTRRTQCVSLGKWKPELAQGIEEKLRLTWSPEQIVGRLYAGLLSFQNHLSVDV